MKNFNDLYGLRTTALRYFNVYGPNQDPASDYAAVIPKFIQMLLAGKQPTIFGDGKQTRDFVFVKDVVRANVLAAESKSADGQVMNIGNGKATSVNSLYEALVGILDINVDQVPIHTEERAGDIKHSTAEVRKARELLEFSPRYGLKEGLKEAIAQYSK